VSVTKLNPKINYLIGFFSMSALPNSRLSRRPARTLGAAMAAYACGNSLCRLMREHRRVERPIKKAKL
jgi:hypothetical protein